MDEVPAAIVSSQSKATRGEERRGGWGGGGEGGRGKEGKASERCSVYAGLRELELVPSARPSAANGTTGE